jgi:hypothetical protein
MEEAPPTPFGCSICRDVVYKPVTTSCGAHTFCRECLAAWVASCARKGVAPVCPACRARVDATAMRVNVAIQEAIERDIAEGRLPPFDAHRVARAAAAAALRASNGAAARRDTRARALAPSSYRPTGGGLMG